MRDNKIMGGVRVAGKLEVGCIFCGKTGELAMYPHRKGGKVVGFVYSCCEIPARNRFKLEVIDKNA